SELKFETLVTPSTKLTASLTRLTPSTIKRQRCLRRHAEAGRQSPDGPLAFSRSHLPSPHPSSSSARPPPLTHAASQSPVKDHHAESQSRRAHQATTRQSRTAPEPTTSPPRRLPPLPYSALVSLVLFFFTEALPICFKF
ncbi:hypothetical protein S245_030626, partial [Arachis hypogaea]